MSLGFGNENILVPESFAVIDEIDSDLNHRIARGGESPSVFEPEINVQTLIGDFVDFDSL